MSTGDTTGAEPGWYPDESGNDQRLRYWDGTAWTDHRHDVAPERAAALPPPASATKASPPRPWYAKKGWWFAAAAAAVLVVAVVVSGSASGPTQVKTLALIRLDSAMLPVEDTTFGGQTLGANCALSWGEEAQDLRADIEVLPSDVKAPFDRLVATLKDVNTACKNNDQAAADRAAARVSSETEAAYDVFHKHCKITGAETSPCD